MRTRFGSLIFSVAWKLAFASGSHNHAGEDIDSGTVADARIASSITRDSEVMTIVLANDGAGSTLDADLLDGLDSAAMAGAGLTGGGGSALDVGAGNAITVAANTVGVTDDGIDGAQLADAITLDANLLVSGGFDVEIENSLDAGQVLLDFTSDTPTADTKFLAISKGTTTPTEIFSVDEDGDVVGTSFAGDGSGLSALNGTNIASGTVAEARIDALIARDG